MCEKRKVHYFMQKKKMTKHSVDGWQQKQIKTPLKFVGDPIISRLRHQFFFLVANKSGMRHKRKKYEKNAWE